MHPARKWYYETLGKKTVEALKRNNFGAVFAEDRAAACRAILSMIPAGATIGFGGSVSLDEVGVLDSLRSGEYHLINPPWEQSRLPRNQRRPLRLKAMQADVFLSGANAVTLDGKLVNTDATGNRIAGMTFGPEKTILVVGVNKITRTLDEALDRVTEVAGPANARRIGLDTPCATTGVCNDCRSADRICNATLILHRKTRQLDLTVVLVGEDLGL